MDLGLAGQRAIVLGASRGLGKAIATTLAAEGARVAVVARHAERLAEVARTLNGIALVYDLSGEASAAAAVTDAIAQLGGVDILIVNTGGPPAGTFETATDTLWHQAFDTLWMSAVGAIRAALPGMRAQRHGRIIVITSIAAKETVPNLMLSNALRAGLHGLVNALSKEVAGDQITVNALMPGYQLTERLVELKVDEVAAAAAIPAGRIGSAEDFAAVAAFLASAPANYVTGQAICVDGGVMQSI
jgi:3-oxoacyl-[acyl-carrier protein] reductase